MQIKTFQGVDMAEAVARIKAEMGSNAVILSSRKIKKAGDAFGLLARPLIEVTAALDEDVAREQGKRRRQPKKQVAQKAAVEVAPEAPRVFSADPLLGEIRELKEMVNAYSAANATGKAELARAAGLAEEIESMKSMMGFLLENSRFYKGLGLDPNYLVCYRRLLERGVEREFARKLVTEVKDSVPGGRELDLRTLVDLVISRIEETMMVGEPLTAATPQTEGEAGPRIISLVGPTGVGKTTTLAKMAAQLTMRGKKVGLVTIDTYRIAAVEQLKTYAGIMGLPLEVALAPDRLDAAVARFENMDFVLIDTAGRSQRDAKKIDELADFFGGDAVENYLVLSAAADPAAIDEAARNFGRIDIAGLVFTKLDESAKPGVVVSQNYKTGVPVVYCTTGQRVPEDIEAASGKKLGVRIFKKEA